jgi:biotin transport system substrate-specific component
MATPAKASTLADLLWPLEGMHGALRASLLAVLGSALLTLSAKLQVPFHPVPMTLQTLVVLLIGMTFGARLGAATVVLYLAEGAAGLPVFAGNPANGIGLAYMVGPTGGYLLGFVLAAAIAGWIVERRRDLPDLVLAVVAGMVAIYLPGLLWLASFVGLGQALVLGLLPFVLGDLVKACLAVALGSAGAAMMRRRLGA